VPFPFSDLSTKKKRPALILTHCDGIKHSKLIVCAMVTSNIQSPLISGDVTLQDWQKSGLPLISKIRLAKLVSLEDSFVIKRIGKLTKTDQNSIKKEFMFLFDDVLHG
jgi:mRNA interferase MazF